MRNILPTLASLLVLAACSGGGDAADSAADSASVRPAARADSAAGATGTTGASGASSATSDSARATTSVRNAAGRELGTLTLTSSAQGITIAGRLTGLTPGAHGIHIHTTGQCAAPFETAGPHWNPTNRQHGTQNPEGPHFGDIPNITVGADSSANVQATTAGGTLRGTNALMDADGAAVVVHAAADDDRTDPSGGSGGRIACGVISGS